MTDLLHEFILESASRTAAARALRHAGEEFDNAALAQRVEMAADGLLALGVQAHERVALWLDKRIDTVSALFGQAIVVLATAIDGAVLEAATLLDACRASLPDCMLPAMADVRAQPLPRTANGKVDRRLLAGELAHLFCEVAP